MFRHKDNTYTIHGLWPQESETSWPSYCTRQPFDPSKIQDLLPELEKYWYAYDKHNQHFWKHEWEKHGTCSGMDEHTYFSTALRLRKKYIKDKTVEHCVEHHHTIKIIIKDLIRF